MVNWQRKLSVNNCGSAHKNPAEKQALSQWGRNARKKKKKKDLVRCRSAVNEAGLITSHELVYYG